jgi:hypothetical protein
MPSNLWDKRIKIIFKDSRLILLVLVFWFSGGFLVYSLVYKLSIFEAFKASIFFKHIENDFSVAYLMWSQGIIFSVMFAFLLQNVMEKYNPERGCRMIAKETQGHIVVVGYSHLGERLVSHFRKNKIPYCLIEKNKDCVDMLLREGEPVVVDDAKGFDALVDANIDKAKAVIIASNNLETALLVTKRARDLNKNCPIATRCFQDEFGEIIETLGANEVISSSKNAFDDIVAKLRI